MPVGSEEYTIKNLNEKTNAEIEGFIKKSKEELFNLRFAACNRSAREHCSPQGCQA